MQISVDIQWARRDKALRDDPNETFAVFYYWLLIEYRLSQQTFRQINFFVEETFDHVLGNEIDHVSLMFISEHESMQILYGTQNECLHILFFYNPNRFFVIPEICLTASVIHSKLNLITNIERSTLWWL